MSETSIQQIHDKVIACKQCPRLVAWREQIAKEKRASFRNEKYWGRALPGFGSSQAKMMVVGLAPAAHGANRTGRMFTGDRSGEWLYRALYKAGFSNQPESLHKEDNLILHQTYITAIVKCAPPANKPSIEERDQCIRYFKQEMQCLTELKVFIALGKFAWDGILKILAEQSLKTSPKPPFKHGAEVTLGDYTLLASFHPSQQNTFTGKLTEPMFDSVFERARKLIINH